MAPSRSDPAARAAVPVERCASIVEVLRRRAAAEPDWAVFTFLQNGETAAAPLTFGALDAQAVRYAARLREAVPPGSRVVLMLPAGYAFIEALFGCLYAGVVPVAAALPRARDFDAPGRRRSDDAPLVERIARDAGAAALITTAEWSYRLHEAADAARLRVCTIRHILPEELADGVAAAAVPPPEPHALAYLQYTSGSTGDPRGVMVSHANLLAAVRGSAAAFAIGMHSRFVSWLPHYHDMGLVGSFFQTVYCGAQCWFMSPQAFVARPERWLAAIGDFGATISGGPNFAYELCIRSAAARAHAFRLHSWECAYNGSEPVRVDTLQRFAAAFAPAGFRPESLCPCYGLAEATLQVSGGPIGRVAPVHRLADDAAAGTPLERVSVSCGRPVAGADVRIVDPDTRKPVPDGMVGEIWVRAPQVGGGYWGKPDASRRVFAACIAGESPHTTYLRTGDAGLRADGELYVLGRYKDAIVLNGVNHQPEPIEAAVVAAGAAGHVRAAAAIGASVGGRERLVVVAEIGRARQPPDFAGLCRELRAAVHRAHDLPVHAVVCVPHLTLPRTTSGKVRRHKVKELYLSGRLKVLHEDTAAPAEDRAAPRRAARPVGSGKRRLRPGLPAKA